MSDTPKFEIVTRAGRPTASSGSKWEPIVGYSRAVRAGNLIAVTGTVGINADGTWPQGAEAQTRRALQIIRGAIEALGGRIDHVIRTRIYCADISQWQAIGAAHAEVFADVRPATSLLQVAKLIDDAALVEIEADAVVA